MQTYRNEMEEPYTKVQPIFIKIDGNNEMYEREQVEINPYVKEQLGKWISYGLTFTEVD